MKKVVLYIADDGKEFDNELDCKAYDDKLKTDKICNIQSAIYEIDKEIWLKYYPEKGLGKEPSNLGVAYIWLESTISCILADERFDFDTTLEDIKSIISKSPYADEILTNYISMEDTVNRGKVKRDFYSALQSVKKGDELSGVLHYSFSDKDISKLAKLHKANKCRKKIEDLLTNCNFHYECGKFKNKEYDEFLDGWE